MHKLLEIDINDWPETMEVLRDEINDEKTSKDDVFDQLKHGNAEIKLLSIFLHIYYQTIVLKCDLNRF